MQTCQGKANERAYNDGQRCRNKGFGITKSGLYDYTAWDRLFARGYRHFVRSLDRDEAREAWNDGWHAEDDRLSCLRAGVLPCGRPI